ncbi:hypothetical protein [Pseudomonas sp. o96-267]|uniref:hypothetical protein n=1 Tax=Pseudomonas sp. o96-267 TaxID=2479853 RepID=UPI000F7A40BC|nr:hypothetical protein [Pseudomonas sp. o96-267]
MLRTYRAVVIALIVLVSGCESVPQYDVSRKLSAIEYAEDLVRSLQSEVLGSYARHTDPVSSLQGVNLVSEKNPRIIGQRLISHCIRTGGTLLPPRDKEAMPAIGGYVMSITYGCKYKQAPSYAFSVSGIFFRIGASGWTYSVTVFEEDTGEQENFIKFASYLGLYGF